MYPIKKKLTLSVLAFTLMMQGCAFLGIDLTDDRTITVVKSPYLISLSGDVEEKDQAFVANTLTFLSTQPFQDYNFTSIDIHVVGSESDMKPVKTNSDITINPQAIQD